MDVSIDKFKINASFILEHFLIIVTGCVECVVISRISRKNFVDYFPALVDDLGGVGGKATA